MINQGVIIFFLLSKKKEIESKKELLSDLKILCEKHGASPPQKYADITSSVFKEIREKIEHPNAQVRFKLD